MRDPRLRGDDKNGNDNNVDISFYAEDGHWVSRTKDPVGMTFNEIWTKLFLL